MTCRHLGALFIGILMAAVLCQGCTPSGGEPEGPCRDEGCSGHGHCVVVDEAPTCDCDEGYLADGLSCVLEQVGPCAGVDCSGHGICSVAENLASCECDPGFVRQLGIYCGLADPAGLCDRNGWCYQQPLDFGIYSIDDAWVDPLGDIWVAAGRGTVLHRESNRWFVEPMPMYLGVSLIHGSSDSDVWAAGRR